MKIDFDFSELEELRKIMGAEVAQFSIDRKNMNEISNVSFELNKGLEIDISQLEIVGGVYSFKGEQLVVHIYETYKEKEYVFNAPENNVRFHLKDCKTIEKMKENNRFETRYIGTNNTDGKFRVRVNSDNLQNNEEIETNLRVCKNCLSDLNYKDYKYSNPGVWDSFNLEEFFDQYKTFFKEKPKYTSENVPENEYPENWQEISRSIRGQRGWECEDCRLNLEKHQNLLHVHHRNHAKFDCSLENLEVICIDCHSKKPGHKNMHVQENQMELIRSLRNEQNIERKVKIIKQKNESEFVNQSSLINHRTPPGNVHYPVKYKKILPTGIHEESGSREKLQRALEGFNRDIILKNFPNTDPGKRLLRPEMTKEILTHMPESKTEFLELIPFNLRQCTDGTENRVFLDRVIEIVNER